MVGLKESDFIFQPKWFCDSEWKKKPAREIMITFDFYIEFLKINDGKYGD